MSPSPHRTRTRRHVALASLLLAVLLGLVGCSGGISDSDDAGASEDAPAPAGAPAEDGDSGARNAADTSGTEVQ